MDIFEQLRGNAVVEANNLTGLRNGHMVAQAAFDNSTAKLEKLENGVILKLNANNELELFESTVSEAVSYAGALLHYSEEHMKFLDSASLDMFNVPLDKTNVKKSYPRAIALYEGDTFTTDNADITGDFGADYADVTVVGGVLTVAAAGTKAVGNGPIAKKATLPNGKAAIEVVWRGGNA